MGILYKDESFKIVGCAMEVHKTLGPGLNEKPYENALAIEFRLAAIDFRQQQPYPVVYKGHVVGECIPDLIAFGKIVVETKTIASIGDSERGQMMNYLKITGHHLGIIINFRHPKLEWERMVR
ncbi:MAG TPA: GxxExxY protein [Bacteroidia bacterium]|nr:GxxExxY protein [Bacteroidia bacterium]